MAEASMEDRPTNRFFCHKCNVHFENATSNFTCPHCSHGFIEELEVLADGQADNLDEVSSDEEVLQMMNISELESFFTTSGNRPPPRRQRPTHSRRRRYADNRPRNRARWPTQNRHYTTSPFENMIQEFIVNLGGVGWADGHANMHLLLGNPGDYAWGREGLDAIVTQLLNQMDSSGPPPLQTDAIAALPLVEINQDQVNSKLQCSVCWEDFKLKENVKLLPCQHVYHDNCINPWLTLHGTCPICRKVLTEDGELQSNSEAHQANATSGNNTFNTLQQLFQLSAVQASTSNGDATDPTHGTSSSQQNDGTTD